MNFFELKYKDLIKEILDDCDSINNTKSITGKTVKFNFKNGFPSINIEREKIHHIIYELLWQLSGCTNTKYLIDQGIDIYNEDIYQNFKNKSEELEINFNLTKDEFIEQLKLQKIDSKWVEQFCNVNNTIGRSWRNTNQLEKIIDQLKIGEVTENYHVITSDSNFFSLHVTKIEKEEIIEYCKKAKKAIENEKWFSSIIDDPDFYHNDTLLYNEEIKNFNPPKYKLSLIWYKDKIDVYKSFKHDYLFYGLLLQIICHQVNMIPHEVVGGFGLLYLEENDINEINEDLNKEVKILPKLTITPNKIYDYKIDNFILDYLFFS